MVAEAAAQIRVCDRCDPLEVFRYVSGNDAWTSEKPDLDRLDTALIKDGAPLTIVIAKAEQIRTCDDCKKAYTAAFRIPDVWWSDWIRRCSAYFGSEDTEDDEGRLDGHSTWFRYDVKHVTDSRGQIPEYVWWKVNIFTRWDASTQSNCVLIMNPVKDLLASLMHKYLIPKIEAKYLANRKTVTSPYYPHVLFNEISIDIHHQAIWSIRDIVRNIEKDRLNKDVEDPSSNRLTEGMRHAIHVSETCETTLAMVRATLDSHELWLKQNTIHKNIHHNATNSELIEGSFNPLTPNVRNRNIASRLTHAISGLTTQSRRADSNVKRLTSEIQLSIHTFSQSVAIAAQEDSRIMKSLTYLGVIFLPATFISALFSTSFFNTDNNGNWYTHPEFWIFWAVTIPVTIISSFCMWGWIRYTHKSSSLYKMLASAGSHGTQSNPADTAGRRKNTYGSQVGNGSGLRGNKSRSGTYGTSSNRGAIDMEIFRPRRAFTLYKKRLSKSVASDEV